ncbi:hypothetical protein ACLMJK_009398 [Lecanora helva]
MALLVLDDLALCLKVQYHRFGAMKALEDSIITLRGAINCEAPKALINRAPLLNNIGNHLGERYRKTGLRADLQEAIDFGRQAVSPNSSTEGTAQKEGWFNNLCNQLLTRYHRDGTMADLEEVIEISKKVINETPEECPARAHSMNILGQALLDRYFVDGAPTSLEEAIEVARQAITAVTNYALQKPPIFVLQNLLASLLRQRYEVDGAKEDIEEAIQLSRDATDTLPEGQLERVRLIGNLGYSLKARYSKTGAAADLEEAISCLRYALGSSDLDIPTRISVGRNLSDFCTDNSEWQKAYESSSTAVHVIPSLRVQSLGNLDKQHLLSQSVGLACDATAIAICIGKAPIDALSLLEEGRGVLATSVNEMRMDMLDLRENHPELAERFEQRRYLLEQRDIESSWHVGPNWRYFAGKELDEVIDDVRNQQLLLPPDENAIRAATKRGPIVMVNASKYRCDAILIEMHQIRCLALPRLDIETIQAKANKTTETEGDLGRPKVLEWLWEVIAKPVLDALEFVQPPSDHVWPHIW